MTTPYQASTPQGDDLANVSFAPLVAPLWPGSVRISSLDLSDLIARDIPSDLIEFPVARDTEYFSERPALVRMAIACHHAAQSPGNPDFSRRRFLPLLYISDAIQFDEQTNLPSQATRNRDPEINLLPLWIDFGTRGKQYLPENAVRGKENLLYQEFMLFLEGQDLQPTLFMPGPGVVLLCIALYSHAAPDADLTQRISGLPAAFMQDSLGIRLKEIIGLPSTHGADPSEDLPTHLTQQPTSRRKRSVPSGPPKKRSYSPESRKLHGPNGTPPNYKSVPALPGPSLPAGRNGDRLPPAITHPAILSGTNGSGANPFPDTPVPLPLGLTLPSENGALRLPPLDAQLEDQGSLIRSSPAQSAPLRSRETHSATSIRIEIASQEPRVERDALRALSILETSGANTLKKISQCADDFALVLEIRNYHDGLNNCFVREGWSFDPSNNILDRNAVRLWQALDGLGANPQLALSSDTSRAFIVIAL